MGAGLLEGGDSLILTHFRRSGEPRKKGDGSRVGPRCSEQQRDCRGEASVPAVSRNGPRGPHQAGGEHSRERLAGTGYWVAGPDHSKGTEPSGDLESWLQGVGRPRPSLTMAIRRRSGRRSGLTRRPESFATVALVQALAIPRIERPAPFSWYISLTSPPFSNSVQAPPQQFCR